MTYRITMYRSADRYRLYRPNNEPCETVIVELDDDWRVAEAMDGRLALLAEGARRCTMPIEDAIQKGIARVV